MKVINKTWFRTDDLRAILSRVANEELEVPKRKRLRVEVRYTRGGGCSGWAYLKGSYCVVRLSKWKPDPAMFASVAAHEYAHLRGMNHINMPTRYKWGSSTWRERYAWADALGVRKVEAKPKPGIAEKRNAKLEHAITMHARALTRAKRAATLAKKWAAKVKRLERLAAAPLPSGERKPRPAKPKDPRVLLRMRGAGAGEFQALVIDCSRGSDEADRQALVDGLDSVPGGWRVKDDIGVLTTLREELAYWKTLNDDAFKPFDRCEKIVAERLRELVGVNKIAATGKV